MSRRTWSLLALAAAVVTSAVLAFAPTGETMSCRSGTGTFPGTCTSTSRSLWEQEGAAVLPALVLPMLITGAALVWRSRRVARGLAIALSVLALLGVLSIGVFLVPTVILAWIAATRRDPVEPPRPLATE